MTSSSALRKEKLTITISADIVDEIDEIVKEKGAPRSRVIGDMLRAALKESKKRSVEKEVEAYYLSLSEKEKKEDRKWTEMTSESAKMAWDD